jgi:hypothetical protein
VQGRCAGVGCDFEGSYKQALAHVQRCPLFAELYVNDPERALDPALEARRVAAERKPEPPARPAPKPMPVSLPEPPKVAAPKKRGRPSLVSAVAESPARERRPVIVEYWGTASKLI